MRGKRPGKILFQQTGDLFLGVNLRNGGRFNFLELRERTERWSLRLAGAAARCGNERESGDGDGGDETDHGEEVGVFLQMADRLSHENRSAFKKITSQAPDR